MAGRVLLALASTLSLLACGSSRPPWADGRTVTSRAPDGAPAQSLANLDTRLLALHNHERAAAGVSPLKWDPALAAGAAAYGPVLAAAGRLVHSPRSARPGQGENLWKGSRGAFRIEEMIGHWAEEKRLFRPDIFPNVSSSGHWSDVAHYTQMIWRTTNRLGCALYRSRESDFLICRYAPSGNVTGQRVP